MIKAHSLDWFPMNVAEFQVFLEEAGEAELKRPRGPVPEGNGKWA